MNSITYLGIDPGKSGGISWLNNMNNIVNAVSMPKTESDINEVFSSLKRESENIFCYIESVHAFPGQGVSSSFNFGKNYGLLRGIIIANGIAFTEVSPQKWQKEFSLLKKDKNETKTYHKNKIKGKAQQMFPDIKITLATSDALMIAMYCKLKYF